MKKTKLFFCMFLPCAMVFCESAAQPLRKKEAALSVKGNSFYMDNEPFDMWGIRVASASQSDALTDHLIAQLDDYKQYGVNTVDVFFQGSSGGFSDPFLHNGTEIEEGHLRRMKKILNACRERGMVVIVGIFYQRTMADYDGVRNINDARGVESAVKSVAKALRSYKNLILNIANEQNSAYYKKCDFFQFNDPARIIDLCKLAKSAAPRMFVGAGGYHDEHNVTIGRSPAVDVLLFDTYDRDAENDQHSLWHYDFFTRNGVKDKPIVNVEMFGGWTKKFMPPGVYDEEGKKKHLKDADEALATPGLYVHFHSNTWCQGPSIQKEARYDLGGMGTETEPGIRWWFDHIRKGKEQR